MNSPLHITRILVPVDGSACSRYAAEHAVRIAQAYAAEVIFLHAVDDQVVEQLAIRETDGGQNIRERLMETGHMYLRDVARFAADAHLAHRQELDVGDPCAVICDAAAHLDVDLIVMGKIGRRGARRILMGSITRRVAESTDRPVLIVSGPPAERAAVGG